MRILYLAGMMFLVSTFPAVSQTTLAGPGQAVTMIVTFILIWVGGFFILRAAVKGGTLRALKEYFGEKPPSDLTSTPSGLTGTPNNEKEETAK